MTTFEELEKTKADINEMRLEIKDKELQCELLKRDYRIQSVEKVIEFIRIQKGTSRVCDIDNLLCHCQNKLLGNIDGIELSLDGDK